MASSKKSSIAPRRKGRGLKAVFIAICVLFGLCALAVFGAVKMFSPEIKLVGGVERVEDAPLPLYTLDIEGDCYFNEFIENGGCSSDKEISDYLTDKLSHGFYKVPVSTTDIGCSCISAQNAAGTHVWGRNFDWEDSVVMIVRSKPAEGSGEYASISTCDFCNVSGDSTELPDDDVMNKLMSAAAYYVPLDGINEAGLCVADLEVNEGGMTETFTEKPDLTVNTAMRLLLNRAATVDEALALLGQYDIHPSGGISHHIAISDAAGNSAVVEFMEGRMEVVNAYYVTNFNMFVAFETDMISGGGESAKERYKVLRDSYKGAGGVLEKEQIKQTIAGAAQREGDWKTQWSIVYDSESRRADYYFLSDFDKAYSFDIPE